MNKKLTQQKLADLLGMSIHAIRKYENDTREPSLDIINEIANMLNVPVMDLLDSKLPESESLFEKALNEKYDYLILPTIDEDISVSLQGLNEEGKKKVLENIVLLLKIEEYRV